MTGSPPHVKRSPHHGFTLVEIAVVLVIVAIMIAMAAFFTRGLVAAQKRSTTTSRLATVDAALAQFAIANKRLPCPANGTLASGAANAGFENPQTGGPCANNQQDGVVPWVTLGLSETDASDGWDRRLTYRVAPELAAQPGVDMSWCDPAGTANLNGGACNANCIGIACTSPAWFLALKGLTVKNVAGTVLMAQPPNPPLVPPVNVAAAYVLVSHGESGGGAYLSTGVLSSSTSTDGTQELKNYASLPYVAASSYFVDDSTSDVAGTTHFDDLVSRPSVLAVVQKAGLGPRAHN